MNDKQLYKDGYKNLEEKEGLRENIRKILEEKNHNDDTRNSSNSSDITIKTTNSDEADFDATAEASHELFSKEPLEFKETADDKVNNAQSQKSLIEEQRRKNYIHMLQSQKGFFFAIFASSIIISTLLIISFTVFVFKFGFT